MEEVGARGSWYRETEPSMLTPASKLAAGSMAALSSLPGGVEGTMDCRIAGCAAHTALMTPSAQHRAKAAPEEGTGTSWVTSPAVSGIRIMRPRAPLAVSDHTASHLPTPAPTRSFESADAAHVRAPRSMLHKHNIKGPFSYNVRRNRKLYP